MTRKSATVEAVSLMGTTVLVVLLLWMSLYLAGFIMLFPAAFALLVLLIVLARKMRNPQALAEYSLFACLIAAQISLLAAILIRVLPSLAQPLRALI